MRVIFSSDARRDRREAQAYYGGVSNRVYGAFRYELQNALKYIAEYPQGSPVMARDVRAKVLAHFPYTLFYRILSGRIFVLAIAHQARDMNFDPGNDAP